MKRGEVMKTSQVAWMVVALVVGLVVGFKQSPQFNGGAQLNGGEGPPMVAPGIREGAPQTMTTAVNQAQDVAQDGALQMSAEFSHELVLAQREAEVYLDVQFQAGESRAERPPRLNVALVLDRSGSMAGQPMAQARRAAARFVERLGPNDRVSVISF